MKVYRVSFTGASAMVREFVKMAVLITDGADLQHIEEDFLGCEKLATNKREHSEHTEGSRWYWIQRVKESLIRLFILNQNTIARQRAHFNTHGCNPFESDRCLFHNPCLGVSGCTPSLNPG